MLTPDWLVWLGCGYIIPLGLCGYTFGGFGGETNVSEHIAKVNSRSSSTIVPPWLVFILYHM